MADQATDSFLDVGQLLESSMPRPRGSWFWYIAGVFALILLSSSYLQSRFASHQKVVESMATLLLMALIGVVFATTFYAARAGQREQVQLEAIEELVMLRRWQQAAEMLAEMLSRPARTHAARAQALIYLGAVLARYHHFGDAITVYDHLLEHAPDDGEAVYGLRLGRAMALLRDDRLFDADRAITELRRLPGSEHSGGLALVEIYRDVKTGHPQEAAEHFERKREVLQRQMGVRMADAMVLAARANDLLKWEDVARALYEDATLLVCEQELARRYPEVAPLVGKYPPAQMPEEAA